MKILSLRKQDMEMFQWMDPEKLLDRMDLPYYFALAGIVENPTALLIASIKRSELAIEWIFVAPGYRRHGLATEMVHFLMRRAKNQNLIVHFAERSPQSMDTEAAGKFFEHVGFVETKREYLQWRIANKEIAQTAIFSREIQPVNVRRMSELPKYMRQTAIKEFTGKPHVVTALFEPDIYVAYDPELSCAVVLDGEPVGIFLCKRAGGFIYPVCFYAEKNAHAIQMFVFAKKILMEEGKGSFNLCIDTSEPPAANIAEQIFEGTGRRISGKVWKW